MKHNMMAFEDLILLKTQPIVENGVLKTSQDAVCEDSQIQMRHYNSIYEEYSNALTLPHAEEYMRYMDDKLVSCVAKDYLGDVAEICCGTGEALKLFTPKIDRGVGIDISQKMLELAVKNNNQEKLLFMQGDALNLPLQDNKFDYVIMLGGIHHVNNREKLFSEVYRILKPGGRFVFREPASDWFFWKFLRKIIYRLSSGLDHKTEAPLTFNETVPPLKSLGFSNILYMNYTFLGFILFMNADILKINKLFKYIPGIKKIVKQIARFDDFFVNIKMFKRLGLQVIGVAHKN
jgi:ubiquinone/menaquinone biosynthesis C-methylase UbiE